MNKIRRWLLAILLVAAVCAFWLSVPSVRADEEERPTSGVCGDNLTWTYEDGTLTISGYGPMYDYSSSYVPWYYWLTNSMVDTMVIEEGITSFCSGAFFNYGSGIDQVYYEGTLAQWCAIDFPDRFANPTFNTANLYVDGQLLEGELVVPEGITRIGDYAFSCCGDLTDVVLPDGLTELGDGAFWGCGNLASINIPQGVTRIGSNAFYQCRFTTITIPDSVTSLGISVFDYCSCLTEITLPDSITQIPGGTFMGCTNLTSVHIPESVTSIGERAFWNCTSLKQISIPQGVTQIGSYAFAGCSSLESINIPEGVTVIEESTFNWCSNLKSIVLPEGVTSIGETAFNGCSSLTWIDIPQSVTSIGPRAFQSCGRLTYVVIPEGVTRIELRTFYCCTSLTNVVMGENVTSIGEEAFGECPGLTHMRFEGGNKAWSAVSIESGNHCLTEAEIHCADAGMDNCARCKNPKADAHDWSRVIDGFVYCVSCGEKGREVDRCGDLLTWTLEDGVLTISGAGKMYDFEWSGGVPWNEFKMLIKTLVIEGGVKNVGDYAFTECTNLTDVTIGSGVTIIGWDAFSECSKLAHISLPNTLNTIYFDAFEGCSSLTSVTIPNSVTLIREGAFSHCSSLTEIVIPDSVTEIEPAAFYDCFRLTNVIIGKNVKRIGNNTFGGCDSLVHILYNGTQESWNAINIERDDGHLAKAVIHYEHSSADTCEYCKNAAIHVHRIQVTQSDENGHAYQCQDCGYESGPEAHSLKWDWNNEEHWQACECGWEQGREAHDLTGGKCQVCGGGSDSLPTYTAPSEGTPTEPGDKADPENSLLWAILGIGLVAAAAVMMKKKK